ncbi:hypothetical protein [Shouchella clausii]|uniref:hypothetical protein n=1 Tax=Shouchella clausii TaxID=79880 RepID=UPI000BA73950|nr:hypothetical protein [Shouchella clausii]PAD14863.1 hypothetical protein CHH74_07805 [Shouchella clausii]
MKNVFLVWTKYQARVESISPDLSKRLGEFEIVYRDNSTINKIKKLLNYVQFFFKDLNVLLKNKPRYIIVQTPPSFALIAPSIYKKIMFKKKVWLISDTHNAMTRDPWASRLGTHFLMKQCDGVCVHNNTVYEAIKDNELFKNSTLLVVEDKTLDLRGNRKSTENNVESEGIDVFFPASFNKDEPILEVIQCARENTEIKITMTGNERKLLTNFGVKMEELPENIKVTGWITNDIYMQKLQQCDILLGLTIFEDIQMSVSNEGLGAQKVMVLSDKKALKEIYKDAAIYTEHDATSLINSIRKAYKEQTNLKLKISKVKKEKQERYNGQLCNFVEKLQN